MRQILNLIIFLGISMSLHAQTVDQIGYTKRGKASYFADNRGGIYTASGERYDMSALVAAHPYIAFNSYVKVTNLDNGKSVVVRINDRMDAQNRIIDLSRAAADRIGSTGQLVVDVKIEIVPNPALPTASTTTNIPPSSGTSIGVPPDGNFWEANRDKDKLELPLYHTVKKGETLSLISSNYKISIDDLLKINEMKLSDVLVIGQKLLIKEAPKPIMLNEMPPPPNATAPANTSSKTLEERFGEVGTYDLSGTAVKPLGYGAQVAWYTNIKEAIEMGKRFENMQFGSIFIQTGWEGGKKAYRVLLGAYTQKEDMKSVIEFLNERKYHAFPKKHY